MPVKALLRRWRKQSPSPPPPSEITIAGRNLPVAFKRHAKARRFVVRLDRAGKGLVVTMPPRAAREDALAFLQRSSGWVAARLAREGAAVPFADGAEILLRGEAVRIIHCEALRGAVRHDGERREIRVGGAPAHLPRRVRDWLKAEARRDLLAASERYAAAMAAKFRKVSIRDQKSRWGSCAADGSLSYSWRLIMAPPQVLDYVAAHEVAHLRHMDHSVRFWRLVLAHCKEAQAAKAWLRANSQTLHKFGEPG
jgi:hypothetical protein